MKTSEITDSTIHQVRSVAPTAYRRPGHTASSPSADLKFTHHRDSRGVLAAFSVFATGILAAIPRVDISPADNAMAVRSGSLIRIEVPSFSAISKVSVDVKTTSAIGIVREFSSSFTTVEPLAVLSARAGGKEISPNNSISPQTSMSFSFDKPVAAAWISIDGAASMPLARGADDLSGNLEPSFVLKQDAEHKLAVIASGTDGSGIAAGEKKSFNVIQTPHIHNGRQRPVSHRVIPEYS